MILSMNIPEHMYSSLSLKGILLLLLLIIFLLILCPLLILIFLFFCSSYCSSSDPPFVSCYFLSTCIFFCIFMTHFISLSIFVFPFSVFPSSFLLFPHSSFRGVARETIRRLTYVNYQLEIECQSFH